MKNAKVIIGGAFGDEGKGLFTDYLSSRSQEQACVVRFNGGAQAGHSVELADGRRHVFSHFGSGTLAGLPTYLSSFFVCSPIIFLRERALLAKLGFQPRLYVDPACPVTTPYDIMINQIIEQSRGKARHGSVGVGFGETLERHGNAAFSLTVADLADTNALRAKLDAIRGEWTARRLTALGLETIPAEWQERIAADGIRERFVDDCAVFLNGVTMAPLKHLHSYEALVFEGAQGLLLDQDYGWFPHVTRSHTGLKNVVSLSRGLGIEALDVHYLTRCYTTRHGAGPLPHELPEQPYDGIVDKTNRSNPYQGSLRFAWFDLDLFADTVARDLRTHRGGGIKLRPHLGMSCLDQVGGEATYITGGRAGKLSPEALLEKTRAVIGAETALGSYGPTRETIVERRMAAPRASSVRSYGSFEGFGVVQNDIVPVLA